MIKTVESSAGIEADGFGAFADATVVVLLRIGASPHPVGERFSVETDGFIESAMALSSHPSPRRSGWHTTLAVLAGVLWRWCHPPAPFCILFLVQVLDCRSRYADFVGKSRRMVR